jgi:GxxExxY protein
MIRENELSKIAVNLAFNIHKEYGPGLFENIYESIFCYELDKMGLVYLRQNGVRIIHKGADMGIGYYPDIVIEGKLILELKSVELLADVHYKQLLTYLRLSNIKLGLLINFNVPLIKNGLHRIVNNL